LGQAVQLREKGGLVTGKKTTTGRFPANLLHDGSDEVVREFPNTKGEIHNKLSTGDSMFMGDGVPGSKRGFSVKDSGSAARFFKSFLYCPKPQSLNEARTILILR
jgi:hypothetical protein